MTRSRSGRRRCLALSPRSTDPFREWPRSTCPACPPDAIELDVERNVLTVKAGRPLGVFSRQLFLGDTLDTEHVDAADDAGVLTLRIPIAERAESRKITITNADGRQRRITT
jgi:HSP20 family protein